MSGSFDDYGDESPAAAPAPSGEGLVDWEDVGKGIVGGGARGVTGLAGTGGTIGELTRAGLTKVGVPQNVIDIGASAVSHVPFAKMFTGPSAHDIQSAIEAGTGKFYEPTTKAGQYASTLAEFAPSAFVPGGGGVTARAFNTVVPALASETAGQATKGTVYEPWARGVAGVVAGTAVPRVITPAPPPSAARQAATAVLDREGIPITAGERTGSDAVRWAEATAADMPLSSGAAQTFKQNQADAFDRAVTNRVFDPAELQRRGLPPESALPAPDVMAHGRRSLSDTYTDLTSRNAIYDHPEIHWDLHQAQRDYERAALPSQRAGGSRDIEAIRNDITDALNRGSIPGDTYQATRSSLGTNAKAIAPTNPPLAGALRDVRSALDRGMERSLSPEDAAAWRLNNERWANMKAIAPAVATATENMTPAKVAQSVRAGRAENYAAGSGNLDELARSAATVIKPLPNSGTAQRQGWQQLFGLPGVISAGGAGLGFSTFGPAGALVGAAVPHAVSRAVWSGPGQRYLSNQAIPQTNRDLISQLLLQQGASQPSVLNKNSTDRADYERKRQQQLRDAGLD